MASGNMKIGIITECIQQLIIKLLNVLCFVVLVFTWHKSLKKNNAFESDAGTNDTTAL